MFMLHQRLQNEFLTGQHYNAPTPFKLRLCGGESDVPKIRGFSDFLAISGCETHFKCELRRNG